MSDLRGFIALHRGEAAETLLAKHPNAFLLLTQIALRARWKDCPITGMKQGEAFIGDYQNAGIHSRKAYRTAQEILVRTLLVRFKGANKGTVATLMDTSIFSVRKPDKGHQRANKGPSKGQQGATKNTDTSKQGYTEDKNTPLTPQGGSDDSKSSEKKPRSSKNQELDLPEILPFQSPEFALAWARWKTHRREIKHPITSECAAGQFRKFLKWGEAHSIATIEHTISQGWQGLVEPRTDHSNQNGRPAPKTRGYQENLELP